MAENNGNELVIVIDMIIDFYTGAFANPRVERIIPNIVDLLDEKTAQGCDVIFLGDSHGKNDRELKIFPAHGMKGTGGAMIIPELRRFLNADGSNYIAKSTYAGFMRTNFAEILIEKKPKKIILVGVCTDICVLHNAFGIFYILEGEGIESEVIIPRNCVETYDAPGHEADMNNKFALAHMEQMLGFKVVETYKGI